MMRYNKILPTLAATMTLGSAVAFAAPGQPYSDEWIEGRISGAIAYNDAVQSSDVTIDSEGGLVTIRGKVPSEIERDFIGQMARSIDGVKGVTNELTIDENLAYEPPSSLRQKMTDALITASVKSKLLASRETHGFSIDVDTVANSVTLNGKVSGAKEKSAAEKLALETRGVRSVQNNLTIDAATAAARKSSTETTLSDAWISSKTRAILTFTDDFPGSDVDVTTNNGRVTLEGFAHSPEQKRNIESRVSDVAGVKGVDNRLVVRTQC